MKIFVRHFIQALGTVASIATLIAFTTKWDATDFTYCHTILISAGIIGLCVLYSIIQMSPANSITLPLRDYMIGISFGDLFKKKGIIVIPVNEYFDTIVDDKIIAHHTLHGQFIDKYFCRHLDELDRLIEERLAGQGFERENSQRQRGKHKAYQLGTCVDIEHDDKTFVLFALTHFNEQDVAYLERREFGDAIRGLMSHLHQISNDRPIYMPLFGTGMSKMQRSHQRVLTYILDCLDFTDQSSFPAGLHIVIYDGDRGKINLSLVKDYFEGNISI